MSFDKVSYVYEVNQDAVEITPLWKLDSPIESCTLTPSLPEGLSLSANCHVTGIASAHSPLKSYIVVAQAGRFTISGVLNLGVTLGGRLWDVNDNFNFILGDVVNVKLSKSLSPPTQCKIAPRLPLGMILSPSCELTGVALAALNLTTFTVYSTVNNLNYEEKYKLSVIGNEDPDLILQLDPRRFDGNGPAPSTCTANIDSIYKDLSIRQRTGRLLATETNCILGLGSGTKNDPYRIDGTIASKFLTIPNSMDLGFVNSSGTIISYYKNNSDTSSVWIFNEDTRNSGRIWSLYNGTGNFTFERRLSSTGLNLNTGLFNSNLKIWNQLAIVFDRIGNKTKVYVNGFLKMDIPGVHLEDGFALAGDLKLQYSKVDFGAITAYSRILNDDEILKSCQSFQGVYGDLNCDSEPRALRLHDNATTMSYSVTSVCKTIPWTMINSAGQAASRTSSTVFDLATTGGQFYNDSACSESSQMIQVAAGQSTGNIYYKSTSKGVFSLSVTPRLAAWSSTTSTMTVLGYPVAMTVSTYNECFGAELWFKVFVTDAEGVQTVFFEPITLSITDGVLTKNLNLKSYLPGNQKFENSDFGYGQYDKIFPNFNTTYSVTIPSSGIPGNTSFISVSPPECGGW
ncbi:MAG: hypothetical protein B7Y39_19145 [Bdellovibrio sp. 28-41-41]|nr:MAG: hypothetical protein B7Y39_19145 [Bdellovibrio sp. 28-41-41]